MIRDTRYAIRNTLKDQNVLRFTSHISRISSPKGFALIELLVTTAIIATAFGISLAKYNDFNRRQIVIQAASEMKTNLRLTQVKALSGEKDCSGLFLGYEALVYGDSYSSRAKCQDDEGLSTWYQLPPKVTAYAVSGFSGFLFKPLAEGARETSEIYLSGYGVHRKIVVEATGNIYIEVVADLPGEVVPLDFFTPTPTPDPDATPTPTPLPFPTFSPSPTPTSTPTPLATATPSPTPTPAFANLIQNPGFENGTSDWRFYTDGSENYFTSSTADHYEGSRAARISIFSSEDNIQLYQYDIPLEPNTDYRLSFAAYSNTGHDLDVYIHKHGSPYTNYGLSGYWFNLGSSWSTFSVDFTSNSSAGLDARLRFWLAPYGAPGDVYWIDQVVLKRI